MKDYTKITKKKNKRKMWRYCQEVFIMARATFNYKGNKYFIEFFPCGNMARVTKDNGDFSRDIKYDSKTTVKRFLNGLEKIRFN